MPCVDPVITPQKIEVEHIRIEATKSFAEVQAALEGLLPRLNGGIFLSLRQGQSDRAKENPERGPQLSIFDHRDHGGLLQITGRPRKAVQYDIGNPLSAARMTRHQLPGALYAPLRILLYESETDCAVFEYDRPSSLFAQFGDERVAAVARELDESLERVLVEAAG
jgi:hypothetical protein